MCIKRKISNIEKFWKAILDKENIEKMLAQEESERELRTIMINKNLKMLEEYRSMQKQTFGKA